MKDERNSKDQKTTPVNPGKEILLKTLEGGAAITDLLNMSIGYALNPSKDRKELEPFRKIITDKFKEYSLRSVQETQVKQSMAKAIEKIKDTALLLLAEYPETDPMWELYFRDAHMTESEHKALGEKVSAKLCHQDQEVKNKAFNWLVSAGFCITDVIYTMEPELEKVFAVKMMQLMSAARVHVAGAKTTAELKDLLKTLEYIKMLESRGVYFDENGDPQYTEKHYELQEREKREHEKFFGNTNTSPGDNGANEPGNSDSSSSETSPGADSPQGTV